MTEPPIEAFAIPQFSWNSKPALLTETLEQELHTVLREVRKKPGSLRCIGKDANEIHHAGRIEGMEPLRDAAVRKLADGITTFEEIVRVTADTA